jgi:hypothetical protein
MLTSMGNLAPTYRPNARTVTAAALNTEDGVQPDSYDDSDVQFLFERFSLVAR